MTAEVSMAASSWTTKNGCVVQFWGVRVYYGTCVDCGVLVHTRRAVTHHRGGGWPKLCPSCRNAHEAARADRSRGSMRKLREKRYAFRDEQYAKIGITPPRQGVPPKGSQGQPLLTDRDVDDELW
ncbi:Uncharacterised protein [Mycobacteroides abscessus subsp. abscessus]|nr:Uncharacterised protein [Mycobacteroides abscessus subsp. abscessus]SIA44924.1 Uncharacterised protein [Mycobacteroides abscessus subsp. abscessus]